MGNTHSPSADCWWPQLPPLQPQCHCNNDCCGNLPAPKVGYPRGHLGSPGGTCEGNSEDTTCNHQVNDFLRTSCRRLGDAQLPACGLGSGERVPCEASTQPGYTASRWIHCWPCLFYLLP